MKILDPIRKIHRPLIANYWRQTRESRSEVRGRRRGDSASGAVSENESVRSMVGTIVAPITVGRDAAFAGDLLVVFEGECEMVDGWRVLLVLLFCLGLGDWGFHGLVLFLSCGDGVVFIFNGLLVCFCAAASFSFGHAALICPVLLCWCQCLDMATYWNQHCTRSIHDAQRDVSVYGIRLMSFWDSQVNGTWYSIDFHFELALVFCLFFLSTHTQTLTHKALLGRLCLPGCSPAISGRSQLANGKQSICRSDALFKLNAQPSSRVGTPSSPC